MLVISDYIVRTGEVRQHLQSRPINSNGVQIAVTKIDISPKYRDVKPKGFYVYLHRRATDGSVFYVGKGKGKRAWLKTRNVFWINVASKNGVIVEVVQDEMGECDAFTLEMWLIAKFEHDGVNLTNQTCGGEGPSGAVMPSRVKVFSSLGECFDSITIAVEYLKSIGYDGATGSNITSCCYGNMGFAYGRAWSRDDFPDHPEITNPFDILSKNNKERCSKVIYCSTGEVFESVSGAADWLKDLGYISASQGTISRAARLGGVSYDRSWSFTVTPKHTGLSGFESRYKSIRKRVDNGCGLVFDSLIEATEWLLHNGVMNAKYHSISKCCNGKQNTAYGYKWRFVNDTNDT